jgi:FkbM family methyltransferase
MMIEFKMKNLSGKFFKFFPNKLRRWRNKFIKQALYSRCIEISKHSGLEIRCIYDIGANKGDWTREAKVHFPDANFILIEGNPIHKRDLEKTGYTYFIQALSDGKGTREFYSIGKTGDSFYKELTAHYTNIKPLEIDVESLDNLCDAKKLQSPDFIKIDVQGAELDVLKGGHLVCQSAIFVYMECPIIKYNLGAPTLTDYVKFMEDIGFFPSEIGELHYSEKGFVLLQVDVLFVNKKLIAKH